MVVATVAAAEAAAAPAAAAPAAAASIYQQVQLVHEFSIFQNVRLSMDGEQSVDREQSVDGKQAWLFELDSI